MTDYKSTITEIAVHDESRDCLTDIEATVIKLADDGGGAYITIVQGENGIRLDINELPLVNEAIDRLLMQHKTKKAPKEQQSDDEHVLAVGQRWRRGDGAEVDVFTVRNSIGSGQIVYGICPASSVAGDIWWYLPNGDCKSERPELALVELLQP